MKTSYDPRVVLAAEVAGRDILFSRE